MFSFASTYRMVDLRPIRQDWHQCGVRLRYCFFLLVFLLFTAYVALSQSSDTVILNSVHTTRTLDCGDNLIVFDKGGATGDGIYASGSTTTNWFYIRTVGIGTPIHIQVEATLASDCSLTLFDEYPSDDNAASPNFATNYPGTHGIYQASVGTTNGTVVSPTGKVSIRFFKSNISGSRTCNFRIRVWTSDTSEVYDIHSSAVTSNSAQVSWSDSSAATLWTVKYGTSESSLSQSTTVSTTSATLTGLQPNRPYYIRIYNNAGTTQPLTGYCTPNSTMIITRGNASLPVGCLDDFTDLSSENVICSYGFYDAPDANYGVQSNRHTVITQAESYDPIIGDSLPMIPEGCVSSVRLGNANAGNEAEEIIYRFQVDASQSDMLLLHYAVVMQNPSSDHQYTTQPRMNFQILREDGSEIDDVCYEVEFVSSKLLHGASPWHDHGPRAGQSTHVLWHDWTTVGVNLSPLDGEVLYIKLTTKDCNQNADLHGGTHFCYAYFTLECDKKDITYSGCNLEELPDFLAPDGFLYDWHVLGSTTTLSTERSFTPPVGSTESYECTMTFSGADDASCSFSMVVNALQAALFPQALFDCVDTVEAEEEVVFNNTSYASSDEEGMEVVSGASCRSYLWDFGDGTTSTSPQPTHQYPSGNTERVYTVTLTAYVSESCTSQFQKTIVVNASNNNHATPDNMDSVDCAFSPTPTDWSIRLGAIVGTGTQGDSICTLINPLVGDLDGDGIPEIVCFSTRNVADNAFIGGGNPGSKVKNVVVYDGRTLQRKAKFDLPAYVSAFEATPFGLAKLYNGDALMVFACVDNNLYAFKLNGLGGATQVWGGVNYGTGTDYATVVGFADFNNDSIPEVYVRNRIFNLATGQHLLTVASPNRGATYAHVGSSSVATSGRNQFAASFAADVVGDAQCELLLGNEIYSIQITNPNGTSGNSATLFATAPTTGVSGIGSDGHVQVADFNLDGYLDVFISCRPSANNSATVYGYVWDVHNNTVSTPIVQAVTQPGKSIPLIADIDNDGIPDVVMHCGNVGANIRAYRYDTVSQSFSLFWTKGFSEDSYSNSMTLFDFNQDGENEMLICDNNQIAIVNGSTPALAQGTISSLAFHEITIMQYPLIVDVNNDGAAEIVFVGKQNTQSYQGTLNICRSNGEPWAPARPVWNQYMYNSTNVNKDLTIPVVLFNNATLFTDPDSGVVRRPFNNFLQQATSLDLYGRPYYTAADLQPGVSSVTFTNQGVYLQFEVCNVGASVFSTDTLYTQIYANQYGGSRIANISSYGDAGQPLQIMPDSCLQFEIVIPYSRLCPFMPLDTMVFAVNDRGQGVAEGGLLPECNIANNIFVHANEIFYQRDTIVDSVCKGSVYNRNGFSVSTDITALEGMHEIADTVSDEAHCQRIRTLMLNVLKGVSIDTTIRVCDSILWNGNVLTETDTYSDTLTTASGCDSVTILHLRVRQSKTVNSYFSACDVFNYLGDVFTSDTVLVDSLTTIYGCDSVRFVHVRVYPSWNVDTTITACDSIWWNGYLLTTSREGLYHFTAQGGCDSTVTLHLTINRSFAADTLVHSCGPFVWDADNTFLSSGDYEIPYLSSVGCDSVWTLHFFVHDNVATDSIYEGCDMVTVWGRTYTSDTVVVDSLLTYYGCDSLVYRYVYVYQSSYDTIVDSILDGFSYVFGDTVYTDSGIYSFTFTDVMGCDSVIVLNLSIYDLCSVFLQFPNLVTPNGDGINDRFVIKNLVEEGCYPVNHLSIYNRWGALVFDAENIEKDSDFWDPSKDNSPTGTYFFIFRGKGFKGRMERRGAIELIR